MHFLDHLCMIQDQAGQFFKRPIKLKLRLHRYDSVSLAVTIVTGMPYAEGKVIAERMDAEWLYAQNGAYLFDMGIIVDYEHIYPAEGTVPEAVP